MKYQQIIDGDWNRAPDLERCCDCGLVHRVWYKRINRRLYVKVIRDNRRTAASRRSRKRDFGNGVRVYE